ncbi:hypothetical protein [Streptomyces sp. DW26H14]|uniref:hypothetical protein n=1 Tax=Streptomyces sp. DW26H14 TaxID=3435395 RepID=UPI00403E2C58
MRIPRAMAVAVAAAGLVGTGLATAPVASAAPAALPPHSDCTSGFVCLYYNSSSNGYGAVFATAANLSDYGPWQFYAGNNGSNGAGVSVKNNAAYVDSWSSQTYRVYYNSKYNCSVACQDIPAQGNADLNATLKNNNASGKFL